MSIPRSNYTQFPNLILDNLTDLSNGECKVIMSICRETLGYHHGKRKLSLSYIELKTGLSRQGIVNILGNLLDKGWILREKDGSSFKYWLNLEDEPVNPVDQSSKFTSKEGLPRDKNRVNSVDYEPVNPVDQDGAKVVNSVDTYKERIYSNKEKENKDIDLNKDLVESQEEEPNQAGLAIPEKNEEKIAAPSASNSKKGKSNRKKNVVTPEEEQEYQPLLDLYNQDKPDKWNRAGKLTHSRLRNLRRYEEMYGKENMAEMMKRSLLGARRSHYANFDWSIDVLIKEDKDWFVQFVERTKEGEVDSPLSNQVRTPADEKRLRILQRTASVVFNQTQKVGVSV